MRIDEITRAVEHQTAGLLTDADAVMALMANGGVSPEDIEEVIVTPEGLGFNIAFVVRDPGITVL